MLEQTHLCAIEDSLTARQKDIVRRINTFPRIAVNRLVNHIAKEVKVDIDAEVIRRYRIARRKNRIAALLALRRDLRYIDTAPKA